MQYCKNIYSYLSKKYPNRNIYVISDHHFYHSNIINYIRENFSTLSDMHNHIIESHNSVVNPDDIVIFLGDFSFKKSYIKEINKRLNGHKYLLLGNHDQNNLLNNFKEIGFEDCFINPVRIDDKYLSHEPLIKEEATTINLSILIKEFINYGSYNYHGHIHETTDFGSSYINTCCEVIDYKPIFIGKTGNYIENTNLFINSAKFNEALNFANEKGINKNYLIIDYIYTSLLALTNANRDRLFSCGSFPMLKKYGYISNISDLDMILINDDNLTKAKNKKYLKQIVDIVYDYLLKIDDVDISFYKRMSNIIIVQFLYKSLLERNYNGYYDINLVDLNTYKESDFIEFTDSTYLEKILKKSGYDFSQDYSLPKFTAKFLNVNGDLANLTLQLLFQSLDNNKEQSIIKKIKYIYNNYGNEMQEDKFDNLVSRFFIKNILFFRTTRRLSDFTLIKSTDYRKKEVISKLPINYFKILDSLLFDTNSEFSNIYNEVVNIPFNSLEKECKQLIKTLK